MPPLTQQNSLSVASCSRAELAARVGILLSTGEVAPARPTYLDQIWAALHAPADRDCDWLREDSSGFFFLTRSGTRLPVHLRDAPGGDAPEHLHLLLDQSGSMRAMQSATYDGAEELVEALPDDATATFSTFATAVRHGAACPKSQVLEQLRASARVAEGRTSLYDAIVMATAERAAASKRTIVIVTDGTDTCSEHSREDAQLALATFQRQPTHRVIFLGSNQDAITNGQALGIPVEHALTYGAQPGLAISAFRAASSSMQRARTGHDAQFTCTERFEAMH